MQDPGTVWGRHPGQETLDSHQRVTVHLRPTRPLLHKCARPLDLRFSMALPSSLKIPGLTLYERELVFINFQYDLATDEPIYFQEN